MERYRITESNLNNLYNKLYIYTQISLSMTHTHIITTVTITGSSNSSAVMVLIKTDTYILKGALCSFRRLLLPMIFL